jgi:lipopolysaccharide heptosyltransferase I
MKILIVKLSSIGDVIHALPALAAIREGLPDAEIGWAVETRSAGILRGNPMIDHLIELDTKSLRGGKVIEEIALDAGKQLKGLRKYSFDIALDMQGLLKSAVIAKLSKAPVRFGFSKENLREPASRFFLTDTVKIEPRTHIIRKNLRLAGDALDIPVPSENFQFPISTNEDEKREADDIINGAGENFAILNPAGGWVTKLWHAEKYGQLADRIWEENGLVSVVATGPGELDLADRVLRASQSGKVFLAQPSLKGFYELAKRARIYIGGDTGPTHIAVAAKAPIIGIFGPTEWWRNGSPNPDDICIERGDISCRIDCHRRTCSNWICMDIDVETVFRAVQSRLAIPVRNGSAYRSI